MGLYDALVRLRERVIGDEALSAVITGIFDEEAPQDQKSPYIVVGHTTETEGRLIADAERKGTLRLHIWSEKRSKLEVVRIYGMLDALVEGDFFLFEHFETIFDSSSGWMHGVVEYRFYFDR